MKIVERKYPPAVALALWRSGIPPLLAKVLAARGIKTSAELGGSLADLVPYSRLLNAEAAGQLLADLIEQQRRLLIVGDYDCDGATATSVGLRALRALGANVGYLIPNRLEHGYGLTPDIVDIAAGLNPRPDYIITVDNGISSHAGIERANHLGIPVIVTDHHLPGATPPPALLIINPNQHGCPFPSKALAGCGVMWYVMRALEDELVGRGHDLPPNFTVASLLPIVAVGTVADVVALDRNNRILVQEGLARIRSETGSFAGIEALAKVAKRNARELTTEDIAFGLGPRINAAGRLETMDAGVECLTCDEVSRAEGLALQLHDINDRRREIETKTVEEAVEQHATTVDPDSYTVVVHDDAWHKGVIGIVAGRLRERVYRPTFVLATGKTGELTGSGRSIPGFHLRDALDLLAKRDPAILTKFGGHAMAAGVTIRPGTFERFKREFEAVAREMLTPSQLNQVLEVDGALESADMTLATVAQLRGQIWGQAFPAPTFCNTFKVLSHKAMGANKEHLRMTVLLGGTQYVAVKFRHDGAPVPERVRLVYKMDVNTYRNETTLQLLVDHLEPA